MLGKVIFNVVFVEEGVVHVEQERELHGPSRRHVRTQPTIYPDCLLTVRSATLAVKMPVAGGQAEARHAHRGKGRSTSPVSSTGRESETRAGTRQAVASQAWKATPTR